MTTRSVVLAGLLLSLLVPAGHARAAGTGLRSVTDGLGTYVPGEVLVKFTPGVTARARAASLAFQGHALIAELPEPGWAHVRVETGQSVADAIAALGDDPGVEYAQPNYVYRATGGSQRREATLNGSGGSTTPPRRRSRTRYTQPAGSKNQ